MGQLRRPSAGRDRRSIMRAVDDAQAADIAIAQMFHNLLGNGTRAQNQRGAALEISEDTLGEFDACERDGHGPRANFGFCANAFADLKRALKGAVENWAGGTVVERLAVGCAKLA